MSDMSFNPLNNENRDKVAVILSMLCVLQCLFLPVVVTLIPILDLWWLSDHFLHPFLLIFVIPLTVFALLPGYRRHGKTQPMWIAAPALILLIIGAFLPVNMLEKTLTVIGATLLGTAHIRNLIYTRKAVNCTP